MTIGREPRPGTIGAEIAAAHLIAVERRVRSAAVGIEVAEKGDAPLAGVALEDADFVAGRVARVVPGAGLGPAGRQRSFRIALAVGRPCHLAAHANAEIDDFGVIGVGVMGLALERIEHAAGGGRDRVPALPGLDARDRRGVPARRVRVVDEAFLVGVEVMHPYGDAGAMDQCEDGGLVAGLIGHRCLPPNGAS
jgi:hypothetical protein